jgi:ubiquitin-like protein Pup
MMPQPSGIRERGVSARSDECRAPGGAGRERSAKVDDADRLLEEIDGILETNATEFLASYVQHGGE